MVVTHIGDLAVYERCIKRRDAISSRIDVNSGEIVVLLSTNDKTVKHRMYMKVFRSEEDHHAHIYSDSGFTKMHGYLRLTKCVVTVDERSNKITISAVKMSSPGDSFMFEAKSLQDTLEWKNSLMPNTK
jgi:hypothetical protein